MEVHHFGDQLYKAYKSGYEDPRPLHYSEIQATWGSDDLPETDALADAFDLGCRHANNHPAPMSKDELLEEMASW